MTRLLKIELGGIEKQFKKSDFDLDIKPLLKLVLSRTFGQSVPALVDMMLQKFITAKDATKNYVLQNYLNTLDNHTLNESLQKCDPKGPLCINILKQYFNEKQGDFGCFGRIISGTIRQGQVIKVLG